MPRIFPAAAGELSRASLNWGSAEGIRMEIGWSSLKLRPRLGNGAIPSPAPGLTKLSRPPRNPPPDVVLGRFPPFMVSFVVSTPGPVNEIPVRLWGFGPLRLLALNPPEPGALINASKAMAPSWQERHAKETPFGPAVSTPRSLSKFGESYSGVKLLLAGSARFHRGAPPPATSIRPPWGVWQNTQTSVVPAATVSVFAARLCFVPPTFSVQLPVVPVPQCAAQALVAAHAPRVTAAASSASPPIRTSFILPSFSRVGSCSPWALPGARCRALNSPPLPPGVRRLLRVPPPEGIDKC